MSSLFHLQEIGELKACKPHTSSRSNLQSCLFFTVVDGARALIYDSKKYELTIGFCVFIDCCKSYPCLTDESNLWTLRWCHFNGSTIQSFYNKYCERGGRPVFSPSDFAPFYDVLIELLSVAKGSDYLRDMRINEELSTLIRLIMEQSWHPEDKALSNKKVSALEVKKYLDEHYTECVNLHELCIQFYISKYYLTHSLKDQFVLSRTNFLLSVRITRVKQLLRFSNKNVEEIGYETGIGAPAYFSCVFKDIEGVNPSLYRDQW